MAWEIIKRRLFWRLFCVIIIGFHIGELKQRGPHLFRLCSRCWEVEFF